MKESKITISITRALFLILYYSLLSFLLLGIHATNHTALYFAVIAMTTLLLYDFTAASNPDISSIRYGSNSMDQIYLSAIPYAIERIVIYHNFCAVLNLQNQINSKKRKIWLARDQVSYDVWHQLILTASTKYK